MTNLLASAEAVAQTGRLFAPAGDGRRSRTSIRATSAAAAAAALATERHRTDAFGLTGPEAITYERIAEDLSAATGRTIEYVDVPDDAARQAMLEAGLPAMMADDDRQRLRASQRAGSHGAARPTAVRALTGREPGTFAQFARDHAQLFGAAREAVSS